MAASRQVYARPGQRQAGGIRRPQPDPWALRAQGVLLRKGNMSWERGKPINKALGWQTGREAQQPGL